MSIKAFKQIEAGTVTLSLLEASVQTSLANVAANTTGIAAINSAKAQPSGFASLDAGGKVPANQMPPVALSEYKGEVADEAAMVLLTAEQGDWVSRTDDASDYILGGADSTVAANWRLITSPNTGVTSMANTSGSISGQNGAVTLADIAFSGQAADIAGLSDVATSGDGADVSFSDGSSIFTAIDVDGALTEVMTKVNSNKVATDIAIGNAVTGAQLISGVLAGTQDDANNAFTVSGIDTTRAVFMYRDGIEQLSSGFATLSGSNITTVISAPASDEVIKVFGYPLP